jgi:hypothetical protein
MELEDESNEIPSSSERMSRSISMPCCKISTSSLMSSQARDLLCHEDIESGGESSPVDETSDEVYPDPRRMSAGGEEGGLLRS